MIMPVLMFDKNKNIGGNENGYYSSYGKRTA